MSLFDHQDVCIAIGSLATLDLPMVVDLIGIYVLKGSYCTLTTTKWFLQALSVIPRRSWRDVARRFTMIRWASPKFLKCRFPRETGWSQAPRRQQVGSGSAIAIPTQSSSSSAAAYSLKCRFPRETGWSQAPRRQQVGSGSAIAIPTQSSSSTILVYYRCSLLRSGSALVSDLVQLTAVQLIRLYVKHCASQ
ncbi:glutathione gamma-glutamylcysteinyltransferase 1-like [Dorcoceras hygrometricum]|uniref:Glutathione gamma-glutamylcysteinyltransferase 1-like n=1 Tax=Dorcoceras hygrometricum TaxID=472368 RepID=A0A2Z7AJQ2_9LAMI|nr:glutathione gamma-glutamylcysteinyltransferase 1-like [Dorcoceras hygrometricum]